MKAVLALAMVMGLAACGGDDDTTPTETKDMAVALSFAGLVNGADFSCANTYNLGTAATPSQISEFKLYVSKVELLKADGTAQLVMLDNDGKWQDGDVALLDFEDGTGACANGNADLNTVVKGTAPEGEYTGVRFELGVPFERNHADAAVAEAPLNITSMFWSWQGGYKFLRVDGKANEGGFRIHLGSTACELGEDDAVTGCGNPNRPSVELADFNVGADTVNVDIGKLFGGLDMTPNAEGMSAVCMADPMHMSCNQVFPVMGLAFGETPAAPQQLFSKK